ncbi:S8 family peptidase [Streptomyces sp. TRM 70351]|uniref:S8 family peptidase n=1 Tax=Streptomyces sp. TRM 70351 TaxID=3116552 RepID=UPI002E7B0490|nr:S8 family peptidase [Streptomyces sp. TRM 70351]MEE1929555.1 S8 family peptidase [Streptomyces sp. TRM 70351]
MRIRVAWGTGAGAAVLAVLAALPGTAGSAGAAEPPPLGTVRGAGEGPVVHDEYIVVLKERTRERPAGVRERARGLARAYGAEVDRTYTSALQGFAVSATETQARRLAADPAVAFVEPNRVERGDATQDGAGWNLDRIDQRALPLDGGYGYGTTAPGVTAYVVDSGIRIGHQDFGGRARYGYNFVDGNTTASDCHGHGTHVAGSLGGASHGVAKGVKLVAVKVLNCNNQGTTANVLAGYDWVARNAVRPAVANVSIGGSASAAKDAAVRKMVAAGITVAVSAGNSGEAACGQSPAREPAVLTVAATTTSDARASWSNHGSCVDLFAPGSSVVSAGHTSDTAAATKSGTSMAAPHVAGAAALYLAAHPAASPATVSQALVSAATQGAVADVSGAPNRLLYSRVP